MAERDIKIEARLFVLEGLFAGQVAASMITASDPAASLETLKERLPRQAITVAGKGLDAAQLALISGEIEDAARDFLALLERRMKELQSKDRQAP